MSKKITTHGDDVYNSGDDWEISWRTFSKAVASNVYDLEVRGEHSPELILANNKHVIIYSDSRAKMIAPSPTATFIGYRDGRQEVTGIDIIGYDRLDCQGSGQFTILEDVLYWNDVISSQFRIGETNTPGNGIIGRQGSILNSHIHNQPIELSLKEVRKSNISGDVEIVIDDRSALTNGIFESIFTCPSMKLYFEFPIENCLFKTGFLFYYDDGAGNVCNYQTLATFKVLNTTYGWGFSLENCENADIADIFNDVAKKDYSLKPTSPARNMAVDGGHIGRYPVSYSSLASDAGWINNTGFTLVSDRFEATSLPAQIDEPVKNYGKPTILFCPSIEEENDLANGVAFDVGGNLDAPVYDGVTASGLSVALEGDSVYVANGLTQIVTTEGTRTVYENQTYATVSGGETLTAVTDAGSAGTLRKINDLSGKRKCYMTWWNAGESQPAWWKLVYFNEKVYMDENGYTNADPSYDPLANPQLVVAEFSRRQIHATGNYHKTI